MSTAAPQPARVLCTRHACPDVPVIVELARFRGAGGVEEIHLMAWPKADGPVAAQLDWLQRGCGDALVATGAPGDPVLRRFFCRDLAHQARALEECPFSHPQDHSDACAVSWVEQPPPGPAQVALWAYHIADPRGPLDKTHDGRTLTLRRGTLQHHWTTGLTSPGSAGAYDQTQRILAAYAARLRAAGLNLADHLVRTWLFLRDIDADYRDFAAARREYFAELGLTPDTHYIASTGIGGTCAAPGALGAGSADAGALTLARVGLDAYAIAGLRPEQLDYLRALDHLCPTQVYGVTFERATRVAYSDRRHVLISGTASIDAEGRLLHGGDVVRQLDRTLENIAALLAEAGAGGEDLCMLIAYLRNPADEPVVRRGIRARFGGVPLMLVAAPVCRPGWLVEVEAQAILPASRGPEGLPPF